MPLFPTLLRRALHVVALLGLLVSAAGPSAASAHTTVLASAAPAAQAFAPEVVLVGLRPGADIHAVMAQPAHHIASAESLFPSAQALGLRLPSSVNGPLSRVFKIRLAPGADVKTTIAALQADPNVEFAEPDYVAQAIVTPNDPQYGSQWALPQMGAPAAWDVTTGAATTTIAIIDSGIDATHEDLAAQLWTNPGETPANGVDDDGNGLIDDVYGWNFVDGNNDLTDVNGHGTEVAGVAGAASNNGAGIAGVCWACKLMVIKVMQASGIVNYSDVAAAVMYAAGEGADVINLSLGGYADSTTLRMATESAAQTAVVTAGAGNDNTSALFYPAAYSGVIAVAATADLTNTKAAFSNVGSWVDVAAPGVNVLTTRAGGNSYGNANGTSLSAPLAAGVAGLLKSQHPDWSAALLREHLLNTATSIDGANLAYVGKLGHGLLSAGASLTTAAQPQMTVTGWALDGQANARPDKNKTYAVALTLTNTWLPARSVVGTLSTAVAGVTIGDASGAFGDLNTDQSKANSADTFTVTFANSLAYGQLITFTLNLSGADGYALSLPLILQVRSDTVAYTTNTIFSTNTVWHADQMYVISATVKVNPGITLTIEPGTVVRTSISGTLRIDGTLVALGTPAQPIVFGAWPVTGVQGGFLNFLSTAANSVIDGNGNYVSGSVLQYVDVTGWNLNLNDRALLVADSTFSGGSIVGGATSPSTVAAGASHIERNEFTDNTLITMYGGSPVIRDNTFTGAGNGNALTLSNGTAWVEGNIITSYGTGISSSGSPTIISNTFTNNSGTAINTGNGGSPVVHDNYIVGNTGGAISGAALAHVDIEHNLIANNGFGNMCPPCTGGGAAVYLDVSSSINSQSSPALAYNPDRDEYLLTWSEFDGLLANGIIKARRVLSDGQVTGGVIDLGGAMGGASIEYNSTQQEYAVIQIAPPSAPGNTVVFTRVSGDGNILGTPVTLATISASQSFGAARIVRQSGEGNYLAVWSVSSWPNTYLYTQRVLTDGTLSGSPIQIGSDVSNLALGDVAYDPVQQRTFVIFKGDRMSDSCFSCVLGAWVIPMDTGSVATFKVNSSQATNPSAAFDGDRFFSVWEYGTGLAAQVITDSAVLSGTGYVTPTFLYSGVGTSVTPRVSYAASNNQFLTVWAQRPGATAETLRAQRVLTNGTLAGGPFLISSPALGGTGLQTPALAYNSAHNEYLVVWADGQRGNQIYGQRVSASGALLDNAWTSADETNPAVNFQLTSGKGVRNNTIINNTGYGLQISGNGMGQVAVQGNNLVGNATYDVYLPNNTQNMTLTAGGIYWGVDAASIPGRIHDCEFDDPNGCAQVGSTLGKVAYDPPLNAPAPNAPAYINAVTIAPANGAPGDPIGIGRATVDITFTAPMVTSTVPTVTFHDVRRGTVQTMNGQSMMRMAQDAQGRLWFLHSGAVSSGASMFDGTNWYTYTADNSGLAVSPYAVFGASNGDVWFGHTYMGATEVPLSRLQGTTWITYTSADTENVIQSGVGVLSIGEDATGKIWFSGNGNGVVSFDGANWRRYTTADGLADNNVSAITRDGQGRMWFTGGNNGMTPSISVFNGASWTIYNQSNGLPGVNNITAPFVDSRGRVWVSVYSQDNTQRIALFDSGNWTYFNNTSPYLSMCPPSAYAEEPNGTIWMWVCGSMVLVDTSGQWSARYDLSTNGVMLFDLYGNFWFSGDGQYSGVRVFWGGADYPVVDNAQWLSPTHFRATHDVTAAVPKGMYVINASDATAADGIKVAPHNTQTFLVDYAGQVTDGTPPSKPSVSANNDGSLNNLSFIWASADAESGIDQYRYAIGTTAAGRNVVDWVYVGQSITSVIRNDLLLTAGQMYYVTVAARNAQGLWSQNGVSAPVMVGALHLYLPLIRR